MVQFDDIDEVSFQAKEEFIVSRYGFEGKYFPCFLMNTFLYIPMGSFTELFAESEFGLEVFRIDRF